MLVLIKEKKPIMICLSETRLTDDINEQEIAIKGYNVIRCDSHTRFTGGVLIYIRKRIQYEIITSLFTEGNWFLSIRVLKGFRTGNYGVVYHSPSSSDSSFLNLFEEWYENHFSPEKLTIIVGDFNIDLSKTTTYSNRMIQIINNNGLKQTVNDFTY